MLRDRAHIWKQTDEVTLVHVMFATTKQKFKATNPEVPPRGEDLALRNHPESLEAMLLSLLRSFGKYHYQGSNPCGGVAQAQ